MKTIKQHWESLPNKKLGEWLIKQPLENGQTLDDKAIDEFNAILALDFNCKYYDELNKCYSNDTWQPLIDALPEFREDEYTYIEPQNDPLGTPVRAPHVIVQPQQDTRRAEVVQLVAAMTTGKEYDYFEIDRLARKAIAIQAEIDKQLNQRHEKE